jgi:hypothetical protein
LESENAVRNHGYIGLAIGQVEVTVPLAFFEPSEDFTFDYLYVENQVDPNPLAIAVVPAARTTKSFVVKLGAAPDSANYVLKWAIAS